MKLIAPPISTIPWLKLLKCEYVLISLRFRQNETSEDVIFHHFSRLIIHLQTFGVFVHQKHEEKGVKGNFFPFFPETNLQLHCRRRCAKRSDWNRSYIFFTVGREGATEPERSWQLLSAGLEQLSHRSPDCIVGGGAGDHINTDCGLSAPLRRWWRTCDVWTAICQHRRDEAEREWDRPFWRERRK